MNKIDIVEELRNLAPEYLQDEWDNSGLLVGSLKDEVKSLYIALDLTDEILEDAIAKGVDMIITHHPLIFKPLKSITDENFISNRILKLVQNNITYYAMHTNFDKVIMSDLAAEKLNMLEINNVEDTDEFENRVLGYGKIGKLSSKMNVGQLCNFVKQQFGLESVKVFGDMNTMVDTLAVMPGSGKSFIKTAAEKNVNVMITGDIDHHEGIDARDMGLTIIDAGHYGIEHIFIKYIKEYINSKFSEINIYMQELKSPFEIV